MVEESFVNPAGFGLDWRRSYGLRGVDRNSSEQEGFFYCQKFEVVGETIFVLAPRVHKACIRRGFFAKCAMRQNIFHHIALHRLFV